MRFSLPFFLFLFVSQAFSQDITQSENNVSLPYQVVINTYKKLTTIHEEAEIMTYGTTDSGHPLHLFVIAKGEDKSPEALRQSGKRILLINNGIHAGEPCGIDASLEWAHDLLKDKKKKALLDQVVVCIIPVYNIGGSLNRGCCSRANQFGPEQYGFRGNAQYLDLNRDFIKNDSRNAAAFAEIFHDWDPDVFIDTHTSNGADYQYVMTLLTTQPDKLPQPMRDYLREQMLPALYKDMEKQNFEMTPYVYSLKQTPDDGIKGFLDSPRYSSGYTALFQTIGFTSETHMFKRFSERVAATYSFIDAVLKVTAKDSELIGNVRAQSRELIKNQSKFHISWELDTTRFDPISFKGFEHGFKTSEVTGAQRLYYDRTKPFEKEIPFYRYYVPGKTVDKPHCYVVPQGWHEVVDRLKRNGVEMKRLAQDQDLEVEMYFIDDYKSPAKPYEGHFLHSNIQARKEMQKVTFSKGDYVVFTNQLKNEYLVSTLEPEATDSYFAWNFFDPILQQKEWFSPYVFEDEAARMLRMDPELKKRFEAAKAENPGMANNPRAQLYYLYKQSKFFEPGYLRYPVGRVLQPVNMPLQEAP